MGDEDKQEEIYASLKQTHEELVRELLELKKRYRHIEKDVDAIINKINIKQTLNKIYHIPDHHI